MLTINVKSEVQQRLRVFLIVFRWLSLILGLLLTGLSQTEGHPHPLPSLFAQMPVLLALVLLIYHLIASVVCFKFDDSKFNIGVLIFLDLCAGAFMAWFYGLPYFFMMVMLPVLEAAFYFGIFVSLVIVVISLAFFGPLIGSLIIRQYTSSPDKASIFKSVIDQSMIFGFSGILIYLNFIWALKIDEDMARREKKFQDEKRMLFESHQETKKEFGQVFIELEKKDDLNKRLQKDLEAARNELDQANNDVDTLLSEVEELRSKAEQSEKSALQTSQKIILEQKEFLDKREKEMEEIIRSRETELEEIKRRMHEEYLEELDNYKEIVGEMESNMGTRKLEYGNRILDLEEKIQAQVKELTELRKILATRENIIKAMARINDNLDIDTTYLSIIEEALNLLPSQTAILFLQAETETGAQAFFAEVAATPYQNLFVDYSIPYGEGSVGWVVEHNRSMIIDKGSFKMRDGKTMSTLINYEQSALIVPIVVEEEVTGALYMGKKNANGYKDADMSLMELYCSLVGSQVKAASQYEKAKHVSFVDEETGLYNQAYFFERFNEETARSLRHGIPMGLVLMEITNFEKFTETFEPIIQKRLLKDLVDILRSNTRESDLVARLNDEQFGIMTIYADKKDTIGIAERIRMGVGLRSFGSPQAKSAGVLLAMGMAVLPEDAEDRDDLYSLAVQQLERAVERGGDQIYFQP